MLPFLKPKKASDTVVINAENKQESPNKLMAISEQLISAIHAKDAAGVAAALSKLEADDEA